MKYLLLVLSPWLGAFSKVTMKKYQDSTLENSSSVNIYLLINCIFGIAFYAFLAKGSIIPNLATLIFSLIFAVCTIFSNIVQLLSVRKVDLVSINVFSGAGAIILPVLFGVIFLKESISVFQQIAVVLLLIVVLLPIAESRIEGRKQKKNGFSGYILCLLVFADSGITTIISKLYAINPNVLADNIFCFWTNVIALPYAIITLNMSGMKSFVSDAKTIKSKSYFFAISTMFLSCAATLISMFILADIDVVVCSIVSSPLLLIYSAIVSKILFKHPINMFTKISIILSFAAVILNLC